MSQVRISELPTGTSLTTSDVVPFTQSGVTKQFAGSTIVTSPLYTPSGTGASLRTIQDKMREYPISVKDFGAVGNDPGDGTGTDDAPAITAALAALPSTGGTLFFPQSSGYYLCKSKITISKRVRMFGTVGTGSSADLAPVRVLKGPTVNDQFFLITGAGTTIEDIVFDGVAGNGGDGIVINANSVTLRDVSVFNMGNDGVRVGDDTGVNSNAFMLDRVTSSENTNHGFNIHDGNTNANAGVLMLCAGNSNGDDGIHLDKCSGNTLVGCLTETNIHDGLHFGANGGQHAVIGGDFGEANGNNDVTFLAGAANVACYGMDVLQSRIVNLGTKCLVHGPLSSSIDWTPTIRGSGTAGTYEIGTNDSTYVFNGSTVTLTVRVTFAGVITAGGTNDLQITNLPIAKKADTFPVGSVMLSGLTYGAGNLSCVFTTAGASSILNLALSTSGGAYSVLGIAAVAINSSITATITYDV